MAEAIPETKRIFGPGGSFPIHESRNQSYIGYRVGIKESIVVHLQIKLDDGPARATASELRPPTIVRLVLFSGDLDEPLSLSMYNLIREAVHAAGRILGKGGTVGIETQELRNSPVEYRSVRSAEELEAWRDQVNRVVFLSHPVPVIRSLVGESALQGAGPGRFA